MDTKVNPRASFILETMRKTYSIIARFRARHGLIRFVPEYKIFKSSLKSMFKKKKK
jgi:hypothetical protein